ncbi:uncharacterized protein LOC143258002 isoform X2 [Tachypleus tridentatus]|uniref:uncharacterized protein LOC143258002 isoform X2 n=1 Tax=Tachypleus tridentatus TaxID=6853 RepID=UPI003FD5A11B
MSENTVSFAIILLFCICLVYTVEIKTGFFTLSQKDMRVSATAVFKTFQSSATYCGRKCIKLAQCYGIALNSVEHHVSDGRTCELLSIENSSDLLTSPGWKIYSRYPTFSYYWLRTAGNGSSIDSVWPVDCNYNQEEGKHGILIGFWHRYFTNTNMQRVKCSKIRVGWRTLLDTTDFVVINTTSAIECPRDYVVTVWDANLRYNSIDNQKCVRLKPSWSIDISNCLRITSGPEMANGTKDVNEIWNFQCPNDKKHLTAMVGVFRLTGAFRITCCNMLQNF